jgi:hypothetical protein
MHVVNYSQVTAPCFGSEGAVRPTPSSIHPNAADRDSDFIIIALDAAGDLRVPLRRFHPQPIATFKATTPQEG